MDEALTGLESSLAVKIYGDDLNVLQDKAIQIKNTLSKVPGFTDLTVVRELGQPASWSTSIATRLHDTG